VGYTAASVTGNFYLGFLSGVIVVGLLASFWNIFC